jgi:hypothetical protein
MDIAILASTQTFENAIEAARQVGQGKDPTGLASPLDATTLGQIGEAWDSIENALRKGFQLGKEKAREFLNAAIGKAEQIVQGAGNKGKEIQEALIQRLQQFLQTWIKGLLAQFPIAVEVGGKTYTAKTLTFNQKLVLSGSLQLSLTNVFELSSSGEIEVSAEYSAS